MFVNMKEIEDILTEANIHPTANRITIYKAIQSLDSVFTLADIEGYVETIDRSTVFRILNIFLDNNLLFEINDGTGSKKYCLCKYSSRNHNSHIHFTCTSCNKTYCIENIVEVPQICLPDSFKIQESNLLIKGICPNCNKV